MSWEWRELGIEVRPVPARPRVNWSRLAFTLLVSVASGFLWYGVYWTAALALQALGVTLTGVPK